MPMRPAIPISCHNNVPMIKVAKGAVHIAFKNNDTKSNRFTSFDSKLTTFPGAVSPSAVWESRKDWKKFIFNLQSNKNPSHIWSYFSVNNTAYSYSNFHSNVVTHEENLTIRNSWNGKQNQHSTGKNGGIMICHIRIISTE